MESFYGGPKGQDFSIKYQFNTKYQLDRDLTRGWTSPIQVGDYVIVSYGLPSDASYDTYKGEDIQYYGKSYNSTLWRKTYTDDGSGSAGGLSYQLIASMTGNTPRIRVTDTIAIDADQEPNVVPDASDVDMLYLTFYLPQAQVIGGTTLDVVDCDQEPSAGFVLTLDTNSVATEGRTYFAKTDGKEEYTIVTFDGDTVYQANTYYYLEDINHPVLRFTIPRSQVIENVRVTVVDNGQNPQASLDTTDINSPVIQLSLPQSQTLQQGTTQVIDADQDPSFTIDSSDINNPILNFNLPQSQILGQPLTNPVSPSENPSVLINSSNINQPVLTFNLPKAVSFYYGAYLGENTGGPFTLDNAEFADYNIGDYYINEATGFIYKIIDKTSGTTCVFEYQACLQAPIPEASATGIDPYTAGGECAEPEVVRTVTGDGWQLQFSLPQAPKFTASFDFVGSQEDGSVSSAIVGTDTVNLDFDIPRGSRLFSGATAPSTVSEALVGDYYLDTSSGIIYQLQMGNTWANQGSLKGPVGDALNIAASYRINETEELTDSLDSGAQYIQEHYTGTITPDDIFAVTWIEMETYQETAYWYFRTENNTWGRVQLTGGISNLIESTHNDESAGIVTNKTYSIHYVNTLIGGDIESKDKDLTTYSATQIEELLSWGSFSDLIP